MKKQSARLLSLLLSLTMVSGMMPNAFAAEGESEAPAAVVEQVTAPETTPAETPAEQPETPVEQPTEEPAQPVEQPSEQPADPVVEKPVEQPAEEPAETPAEEPEQPVEEPAEAPAEEPAQPSEDAVLDIPLPKVMNVLTAADSIGTGTLGFSKDVDEGPYVYPYAQWGNGPTLEVKVDTYTPAGGEATVLPDGTNLQYQWYYSEDDTASDDDPKIDYQNNTSYRVRTNYYGMRYFYVKATATIDGVEYVGISKLAAVKIKAADAKVTLTVNNKGMLASDKDGNAVCNTTVTVSDIDEDGKLTYDEALVAAHKALMNEDDYATTESSLGLSVTKFWGVETSNLLFYNNGKALETNVGDTEIKAKNSLYASINQDDKYYSDKFTKFDVNTKTASEGVEFELTLTDENGAAVPGVAIGSWENNAFVPYEGKVTDESGKVTLSFANEGTYCVTANGTIKADVTTDWSTGATETMDCPIMAPGCTVTVKKLGEIRFGPQYSSVTTSGSFGDQPYTYKVGETNAFYNMLYAYYYGANGKKDSKVSLKTTWYRLAENSAEPEKVDNISAAFTSADVGNWQYYLYAEGDAYGVKVSRKTNFANVVITEPSPIESGANGGYITRLTFNDEELDLDQHEQALTALDNGGWSGNGYIVASVKPGNEAWYGILVDGIRNSDCGDDEAYNVTLNSFGNCSVSIPKSFETGSTHVVTLVVGPKYDSNQDGKIDKTDAFNLEKSDVYNFTVTLAPAISAFSATDADGNTIEFSPTPGWTDGYVIPDSYGVSATDTIKLSATFKDSNGVKLYINDKVYDKSLSDEEINLADFRDDKNVANIPLRTVYETADGGTLEYTTTLHLTKAGGTAPVITKQPAAYTELDKDTSVKLSVEVEEPTDGSTISYQWKVAKSEFDEYTKGTNIEGATEATYEASAEKLASRYDGMFYACLVTKTMPDGSVSSVLSDSACVKTLLTYISPPEFSIQPGLAANGKGTGIYRTTYQAGSRFDPMFLGVQCVSVSENVDGKFIYHNVTENGCTDWTIKCYYNTEPSYENATEMPIELTGDGSTGGDFGWFSSVTPTQGLPEGTYYVFFVVTSTVKDGSLKPASAASDFVKLTYTKAEIGFEGGGTAADPFQLKTGDDFVKIQKLVNEGGQNLSGMTFKMMNDITLPEDWIPIGYKESIDINSNDLYFGGTIDGGGYQLSYAKHSKPLIQYASNARIQNLRLYGEEIQGNGLIDGSWLDNFPRATIQNVTLVSGTSTLYSGLTSSCSKAANTTTFINCHAEEGVIIGYTKDQSGLGTFTSGLSGTMEGCSSAATVYGVNSIGGLVGTKPNSMSDFVIKNCSFTGKIEATGQFVGGIAAKGYTNYTAPNARCASVENCYVNADISGKDAVGGIYGGEGGVDQCWANGVGNIRNNVFYGSLTATGTPTKENLGGSKGGIIGFMRSLDKYNVIENNYFYEENGLDKAIGGVEHIDTSARKFGMNDDGIFYYDTSKDSLDDIKEFVDAEDKGTPDWNYTSVCNTNHNRTDDPMGADADKLGKSCTTTEMADGTVLKLLNASESSMKNWEQGEKFPTLSNKATVTSLTLSGNYKTEYYIGEALDMTGATFTAYWSDGTTTNPSLDEVKIEGFDSSKRAVLTLKASYASVSTEFEVKVLKRSSSSNDIRVSFTLLGDDNHGDPTEDTGTHTLKSNNLKTWLEKKSYTVDMNATVWDLIQRVEKENDNVSFSNPAGNYVDKITFNGVTLGEFDNGQKSGWMYTLNGHHPLLGVSEQFLENGDNIVFHYTDDYTIEEGSEPWWDENHSSGGGSTPSISTDQTAANTAIDQIKNIGTVTKDSGDKIQAAREAYNKLTDAQKKLVTNYNILTAAEKAYASLTGTLPFTDVSNHWAYNAIKYAYENGLFSGISDTEFGPNISMNRAMLVTVLYRLEKEPNVTVNDKFTDIASSQWYAKAVAWANANGIISGYSDTVFGPNDLVTREQMAAILNRYAKYKGLDVSASNDLSAYTDKNSVSDWALSAMQWANANKLINGRTETTLAPQGNATRAEVAQILMTYAQSTSK